MIVEQSKRSGYIDFIKGIAILLVLVGHAIQYCYGAEYLIQREFLNNSLFRFIYTFHMPLFMAVSGYLLQRSLLHRTEGEVALRRLRQLVIPILSFGVMAFAIKWAVHPIYNLMECVKELFHTCIGNLWFLWALLYNQLLLLFIHRMGDKIWMYVIAGIMLYFIPESNYIPAHYTSLYPFLVLGYMTGKFSLERVYKGNRRVSPTIVMLVLYVSIRYINPTLHVEPWVHTIIVQCCRLCALGWILPLLHTLYTTYAPKNSVEFIVNTGRDSLGIYYFQTLIFILISRTSHLLPSLGVWGAVIGFCVVTAECLLLAKWSKQYRITRLLVLGCK